MAIVILDGVGIAKASDTNAVHLAKTPTLDALIANKARFTIVKAHGTAVGLPSDDDMGNSEVGHNALGCGRVVAQGASLVDDSLASGSIYTSNGWKHMSSAFADNTFHVIGLLSDGGVHSRYNQITAICKGAAERGAKRIRLHVLLDGRDVPDGTSITFVEQLQVHPSLFASLFLPASLLLTPLACPGGPRRALCHGLRREDRLWWWAHDHHHGPLRGRLGHRQAWLARARVGEGRTHLWVCAGCGQDDARGGQENQRPVPSLTEHYTATRSTSYVYSSTRQ
jgi:hypothetical protein